MDLSDDDRTLDLLRESFATARDARQAGNHPFGAVLADSTGRLLLRAGNSVASENDPTAHAELNLIRSAVHQYDRRQLAECTLYASTEPCPMCSGAIFWGGVARVVYGLSQEQLYEMTGQDDPDGAFILHCRDVLARAGRPVEVVGPLLEDEALEVHRGFWITDP